MIRNPSLVVGEREHSPLMF